LVASFLIPLLFYDKVLFIAPLHGRSNPHHSCSDVVEVTNEMLSLEDLKDESAKDMAAIEKARHENTKKRPSKRGSKVCSV